MPRNVYFSQAVRSEQQLYEDLIVESLKIYGQDVYYIPRTLINRDAILDEDPASKFDDAYLIEAYLENVDGFNNTIDFLKKFNKNKKNLAAVILEPTRAFLPNREFIRQIRSQCTKFDIPLIYDEITVGWRVSCGGFHKKLKYKPDIAVFSKATSNGYPLGAILGKKKFMDSAQDSFISSAYWTENIGLFLNLIPSMVLSKRDLCVISIFFGKFSSTTTNP